MKKLGIFGGTFSPPHIGHIRAALAFYDEMGLDELLIMPAYIPPHKAFDNDALPEMRFTMAKLAFGKDTAGERNITVSDYEIHKEGKSYTSETVQHFSGTDAELFLLVGTDMFLSLDLWHEPETIFSKSIIVLARRENDSLNEIEQKRCEYETKFEAKIHYLNSPAFEVSSTQIREMTAAGKDLSDLLTVPVTRYIENRGLYGSVSALDLLRSDIKSYMSASRYSHSLAVERECAHMGEFFALGSRLSFKLRAAALLHDITHDKSEKEQLILCSYYNLNLSENEKKSPQTLHALTGAHFAADLFGYIADDELCSAIACHTTGKPEMTVFEKLLCLADFIEDTRKYNDCVSLRKAFWEKITPENRTAVLDEALLRYFENTIAHVEAKGGYVNEKTIQARQFLIKNNVVLYNLL